MKIKTLLIGTAFCTSVGLHAQNTQISVGADVGIPVGDFGDIASLVIGPSLGAEFPLGTGQLGLTVQAGYQFVTVLDEYGIVFSDRRIVNRTFNMIPAQLGLKYYFAEPQLGFYAHGQAGIHHVARRWDPLTFEYNPDPDLFPDLAVDVNIRGRDVNYTAFSWALGVGYQLQNLDIGLRFNALGPHDLEQESENFDFAGTEVAVNYSYRSPALSYIGIRIAYLFNLGGGTARTTPVGTP